MKKIMFLMLVLVFTACLVGCSSSSKGGSINSVASSMSETTEQIVKEEINAFVNGGLDSIEVAGVEFSIPQYYEKNSVDADGEANYYYAVQGGGEVVMIMTQVVKDEIDTLDAFKTQEEEYAKGVLGGMGGNYADGITINESISVADMPGRLVVASGTDGTFSGDISVLFFFNEETSEIGNIIFCQSDTVQADYLPDFKRIVESAKKAVSAEELARLEEEKKAKEEEARKKEEAEKAAQKKVEEEAEQKKTEEEAARKAEAEKEAARKAEEESAKEEISTLLDNSRMELAFEVDLRLQELGYNATYSHNVTGMDFTYSVQNESDPESEFYIPWLVVGYRNIDTSAKTVDVLIDNQENMDRLAEQAIRELR